MSTDIREVGPVVGSVLLASRVPTALERALGDSTLARHGCPPLGRLERPVITPEQLAPRIPNELRGPLAAALVTIAGDDPLRQRIAQAYAALWARSPALPGPRGQAGPFTSFAQWLVGPLPLHYETPRAQDHPMMMNGAYRASTPEAQVAPSSLGDTLRERVARIRSEHAAVVASIDRVLIGKRDVVERVLGAMAARGHVLLVDAPGVGKTLLCKAVSAACGVRFGRVQFTPDLLPMDLTGGSVYDAREQRFVFRPGPIFAPFLLADEINRATPKTQSALLEVMEERTVTVDGTTHPLPEPFQVLATMNPLDHEGTFALPAAQIDRFMVMLELGHPTADDEIRVLDAHLAAEPHVTTVRPVLSSDAFVEWQRTVPLIHAAPTVKRAAVDYVQGLRRLADSPHAVSPRATLAWMRAAQARAMFSGREFVTVMDLLDVAPEVLRHRLSMTEVEVRDRLRHLSPEIA